MTSYGRAMTSRELMAYGLALALLIAFILFVWRVRSSQRRASREDRKTVHIDLMKRPADQPADEADGSR